MQNTRTLLIMAAALLGARIDARPQKDSTSPVASLPEGIWEASNGKGGAVGINLWAESSSLDHGGPPVGDKLAPIQSYKLASPRDPVKQFAVVKRTSSIQAGWDTKIRAFDRITAIVF